MSTEKERLNLRAHFLYLFSFCDIKRGGPGGLRPMLGTVLNNTKTNPLSYNYRRYVMTWVWTFFAMATDGEQHPEKQAELVLESPRFRKVGYF